MSSILRRVWQRLVKPAYLVGRDLEGNKYFEYPNANGGRPKRTVQYRRADDMWTYIASGKKLPVQWNAWLTHTRPSAPSIEELQEDLVRQRRVQMNASILEARDKEEREQMTRLVQSTDPHLQIPQSHPETESQQKRYGAAVNVSISPDRTSTPARDPWAEAKRATDEPQPWSPVVRRR